MENKVLETIIKYNLIEDGDKVVVAVSGGPDSITLLDILNKIQRKGKIKFKIIIAHVNHQIREEAIDDEKFVQNYANNKNIECYIKRIDVINYANNNKMGFEEPGRKVRYAFFEEVMQKENANKIAIAHNKNDKIETMFMNIFRGSGISGLKGIEPIRENKYIRPLIECERSEIEKYCEDNNLNPRIDKTNFINDCTRNKIRNIVLPYIKKEFNPNIIETMSRLSEVATETEDYIKKQTIQEYNEKRILIYAIHQVLGNSQNIEKVNIDDLINLCEKNIGNKYLKPNKNIKILVNKGKIFLNFIY